MVNEYNLDEKAGLMNERDIAEIIAVAKRKIGVKVYDNSKGIWSEK